MGILFVQIHLCKYFFVHNTYACIARRRHRGDPVKKKQKQLRQVEEEIILEEDEMTEDEYEDEYEEEEGDDKSLVSPDKLPHCTDIYTFQH